MVEGENPAMTRGSQSVVRVLAACLAWVCLSPAIGHPDLKTRILPRDLSVFAHTNPVYFLKDGAKVRKQPSIEYLQKYVQGTLHWLATNPKFHTAEDALEVLRKL
jgi:hypothetical protein